MTAQGELNLHAGGTGEGYAGWLAGRKLATAALARRLNLPLQHEVEVWLTGGIRLRGRLRLQESMLFIEENRVQQLGLLVDNVPFMIHEMESCVRLD